MSEKLKKAITARESILMQIADETDSTIEIHDALLTIEIECRDCPLSLTKIKQRYDQSIKMFETILSENKRIIDITGKAESELRGVLIK
jgi:hypothetical protein